MSDAEETNCAKPIYSIAVIGAGIVGVSTALQLRRNGHDVTLIDPRAPGTGTSFGNAGGIVVGAVVPISTPSTLRAIPKMLLDRESAVRVRFSYLVGILPWLMRFLWSGRSSQVQKIAASLSALLQNAVSAHRELAEFSGAAELLHDVGWLKLYETEASFEASRTERDLMARHGVATRILGPAEIAELEPNLAPIFAKGVLQTDSKFVSDPWGLTLRHFERFRALGGHHLPERLVRIEDDNGKISLVTDLGIRTFDRVVLATGAWSREFAQQLGQHIPLDTERGYHLNLDYPQGRKLNRPVVLVDKQLVLAPMADGVRLTSGIELAGLRLPPNFTRIRNLQRYAQRIFPGIGSQVRREWMGFRPSMPDSLPVIGPSHNPAVFYAFGHGHLGLTLGPITGKVIADLIDGQSSFDLTPYSADRFHSWHALLHR